MHPDRQQAIGDIAEDRVRTTVAILQEAAEEIPGAIDGPRYAPRRRHLEEFAQRAVALTSDALELVETEGIDEDSVTAATELLASADVFLEALQDLLMEHGEAGALADRLGAARVRIDQADVLLRCVIGEY